MATQPVFPQSAISTLDLVERRLAGGMEGLHDITEI